MTTVFVEKPLALPRSTKKLFHIFLMPCEISCILFGPQLDETGTGNGVSQIFVNSQGDKWKNPTLDKIIFVCQSCVLRQVCATLPGFWRLKTFGWRLISLNSQNNRRAFFNLIFSSSFFSQNIFRVLNICLTFFFRLKKY